MPPIKFNASKNARHSVPFSASNAGTVLWVIHPAFGVGVLMMVLQRTHHQVTWSAHWTIIIHMPSSSCFLCDVFWTTYPVKKIKSPDFDVCGYITGLMPRYSPQIRRCRRVSEGLILSMFQIMNDGSKRLANDVEAVWLCWCCIFGQTKK